MTPRQRSIAFRINAPEGRLNNQVSLTSQGKKTKQIRCENPARFLGDHDVMSFS